MLRTGLNRITSRNAVCFATSLVSRSCGGLGIEGRIIFTLSLLMWYIYMELLVKPEILTFSHPPTHTHTHTHTQHTVTSSTAVNTHQTNTSNIIVKVKYSIVTAVL
jgi:hypothetical protein